MAASNSQPLDSSIKQRNIRYEPEEYNLRKRLPPSLPRRYNDVYVNTKTHFAVSMKRCQKLLDSGENEIYIHGIGLAVNRAVNIALQLQTKYLNTLVLSANTSTIDLVDDFEPLTDDGEFHSQTRNNSAIHIKVKRSTPLVEIPSALT